MAGLERDGRWEPPTSAPLPCGNADKEAHGEFDSECPGYCGAQDTFYVGTLKGVGRVYQQTVISANTSMLSADIAASLF